MSDFNALLYEYRRRQQHVGKLSWGDAAQHVANWREPDAIYLTFHNARRLALHPLAGLRFWRLCHVAHGWALRLSSGAWATCRRYGRPRYSATMNDDEPPSQRTTRATLHGLIHSGETLVKRGTAMGPLVPVVFLVTIVGGTGAWLFKEVAVYGGMPVIAGFLVLAVVGTVAHYLYHFSRFAKHDPDRPQSEDYRLEDARMQVLADKNHASPPRGGPSIPCDTQSSPRTAPAVADAGRNGG